MNVVVQASRLLRADAGETPAPQHHDSADADAWTIAEALVKGREEGLDIELTTPGRVAHEFGIKRSEIDRTPLFYRWQDHTVNLNPSSDVWKDPATIKAMFDIGCRRTLPILSTTRLAIGNIIAASARRETINSGPKPFHPRTGQSLART